MDSVPSVAMNCGVGGRCSLDPILLWLWCRPAATAPICPLAWELPYAMGAALGGKKKKKKRQKIENKAALKNKIWVWFRSWSKSLFQFMVCLG